MHPIYKVIYFKIITPYTIKVGFDDNTFQTINFKPVLKGKIYSPLINLSLFNKVKMDKEVHTLVWPNGADFDPATLHDWSKHEKELIQMASIW